MVIRLDQLLSGTCPDATVACGAAALAATVQRVAGVSTLRALKDIEAGTLVVVTGPELAFDGIKIDVAVRFASSIGIVGLVGPPARRPISLATTKLAERYHIPLIVLDAPDSSTTVAALDTAVRAPDLASAQQITSVLRKLSLQTTEPEAIVGTLTRFLSVPTALVDPEGRVIAGQSLRDGSSIDWTQVLQPALSALDARYPAPGVASLNDDSEVVLHPVRLPGSLFARFWFVALRPTSTASTLETIQHCLGLATWAFTTQLAARSLVNEREGLRRALLLTEILENSEAPPRHAVESAALLGWSLSGWHVGVHVSDIPGSRATHPPIIAGELAAAISEGDLKTTEVIERADGWVWWFTDDVAADAESISSLSRSVRRVLSKVESEHAGLRLCAGVGIPHQGSEGLRETLREAHQASLLAASRDTYSAVERTDPVGFKRLLLTWYANAPGHEIARDVLRPIADADPSGQLIRTLACFLDYQSSPTETAAVLGVHRNTVLKRIARIKMILGTDLSDPNERLAAHLATRAFQMADGPGPE